MYNKKIKVLFLYSQDRQDEGLQKGLEEQLHELRWLDVESQWYKSQADSQENWNNKIYEDIDRANLIVPLISASLLNDTYLIELIKIAKRRCEEKISLIPVLIRQTNGWQRILGDFTPLPSNGKAVNDKSWANQDEAFVEIAGGIVEKVEELIKEHKYCQDLQEYEKRFYEAIQQEETLSDVTREQLNNFKRTRGLKDNDTSLIEEEVYRRKEQECKQKSWQWDSYFYTSNQENDSQTLVATIGVVGIILMLILGSIWANIQDINSSKSPSSTSKQTESLTINSNYDGWIFLGRTNNSSENSLNSNLTSISTAKMPSVGSVVTLVKPVNLRNDRPQKPNFNHEDQKVLSVIQNGEKVVVLDTFVVPGNFAVWAKIRKCDDCN